MARTLIDAGMVADADFLSEQEHTAIGDSSPHHARSHSVLSTDDHSDVDGATPDDGDVLTWDDTAGTWGPAAAGGGFSLLASLSTLTEVAGGSAAYVDIFSESIPSGARWIRLSGWVVPSEASASNRRATWVNFLIDLTGPYIYGQSVRVCANDSTSSFGGYLNTSGGALSLEYEGATITAELAIAHSSNASYPARFKAAPSAGGTLVVEARRNTQAMQSLLTMEVFA